jgi:transcriptional regulator with XRE-family HTH domain
MEPLSQRLARLRAEADLNQIELGRLIHRTNSYISRIESGQREPTPALISDWLKACTPKLGLTDAEHEQLRTELQDQLAFQTKNRSAAENEQLAKVAAEFGDYAGHYYLYNFPSFGGDVIAAFELTIEKKLGRFLAQAKSLRFVSHYTGELLASEQNIQIDLDCVNIPRKLLYTFHNPPTRKIHKLWGIASGSSAVYEPMALIVLLSREWLDDQAARQAFAEQGYTLQNSLWRIPKDGQVFLDNLG